MLDRLRTTTIQTGSSEPTVVHVDSEAANEVLDAMSSQTAREILSYLHNEPQTPSQLAEQNDLSLPTIQYHLDNLQEADLIEVVGTKYSEKGNEMKIYAPADNPVVFVGTEEERSRVRKLLGQLLGAIALLAATSIIVQWFVTDILIPEQRIDIIRKTAPAGQLEGLSFTPIPPGLLFFTGGTFILMAVIIWRYRRQVYDITHGRTR
ncbi:MAG: ArsR/SmtB family transcription factor [Halobacteriaceae archaeon]